MSGLACIQICYSFCMNNDDQKTDFGLPTVSYDPLKTIDMEGRVFRGVVDPKKKKSLFVRSMAIALFTSWFLLPGLTIVCVSSYGLFDFTLSGQAAADSNSYLTYAGLLLAELVGLVMMTVGVKVIVANIKRAE